MNFLKLVILGMNQGGFLNRGKAFLKYLAISVLSLILEEIIRISFLPYYPMGSIILLMFFYSLYVVLSTQWKNYKLKEGIKPKNRDVKPEIFLVRS